MVRMTSWFTRLVGGRPRAACWWRGGRRGGASGAEPSVNLTQTCPAGPGQPRETNNNLESVRSGLKKPRSVASDDRVQRISCHRTRTTRIALTSRGAAPTSLPTFCLKFCLHWVELSPRNCMDLHTRRWHGIYQMCRIMNRSLHFNRGNARDAVAGMGAGYKSPATLQLCYMAKLGAESLQAGRGWREASLAIES